MPEGLLGRHVLHLALDDPSLGLDAIELRLGDPEVADLDVSVVAHEDVRGAEVAVYDVESLAAFVDRLVSVVKPIESARHDVGEVGEAQLLG